MKNDENQVEKTQLKSIHLKLNEELLSEIDDFTKEYYFTNRTDAMRYLLASGLKWQKRVEEILNEKKDKLINTDKDEQ